MDQLEQAREIINETDRKMAELFLRRMEAAGMVAEYKREHGMAIVDEAREAEVIRRNSEALGNDGMKEYYVNFLQNVMEVSKSYQRKQLCGMRTAYSGTEGAFAHIATRKLFPGSEMIAYPTFADAYRAVEDGVCDAAVLPIENSSNGEVGQVTDLMFSGRLYVNEILDLAVTQDLLVKPGARIENIRTVVSHPQALGQCAERVRAAKWNTVEYPNTALAAKYVAEQNDPTVGAIASAEAAELFGLEVAERNLNENRSNTTRFAVFSRSENNHHGGRMGTHFILVFTVRNEAGALARAIDVIGHYGFNMRTIRSRPMKELLWQYYFYIEAEGNIHTSDGENMIRALSVFCDRLKLVGCYSRA